MASGAESIDSWSDSEIRTKLAELGTPVGPVTETTRKILIKKLKRLLQLQSNNAGSPAKQRRSLIRYSSEESQGEEANMPPPATKVKNLRRKTVGPTELSSVSDSTVTIDVSRSGISERTTRGSRKSLGVISAQKDSLDTDSDSDPSLISRPRLRKSRRPETSVLGPSSSRFQDVKTDSSKSWHSHQRTSEILPSSSRVSAPQVSVQEEEEEEEELEDTEEEEEEVKAPVFQSDFLTRLSNAGKLPANYRSSVSPKPEWRPASSSFSQVSASTKPEWRPSSSSYSQNFATQSGIRSDDKIFSTRHEMRNSYSAKSSVDGYTSLLNQRPTMTHSNIASKVRINNLFMQYKKFWRVLLGCVAVLGFLFAVYFFLLPNFSTRIYLAAIDSDDNKYPICGQEDVDSQVCVPENQLKSALDVSKVLIPRVLELTTKAYCDSSPNSDSVENPKISEEEALKFLGKKMPAVSHPNLERDLRNFKILVMANPHWEVEIVSKGLTEINAILFNGDFAARRVDLPTMCYLRIMAYKLIKIFIFIGILAGTGFVILFGVRLYKRAQEKHKQDIYSMVNRILNLLSAHHEQNTMPGYLAVNNCRDELIPPSERDKKKRVWDDAVEFLESHESRVRTEVHSLRGENVKVWRWLPAGGPPMSPNTSIDSSGPILGRLL